MGYAFVKMTEYDSTYDEFYFDVQNEYQGKIEEVALTGSLIGFLKEQYDLTNGEGMNVRDVAIMCILHDQDDIDSDDPTEFIGRSFEYDV